MSRKKKRHYLYVVQHGCCAYCFTRMTMRLNKPNTCTLDHIVPRSRGGPTTFFNLVGACATCNHEKADRPLHEFLVALRRKQKAPEAF